MVLAENIFLLFFTGWLGGNKRILQYITAIIGEYITHEDQKTLGVNI